MTYAEFVDAMLDLAEKGLETVLRERGEHMPQWLLDKRKSDRALEYGAKYCELADYR